MNKLTGTERKDLPSKDFAGPDRSYPVENKAHARAAELDAGIAAEKGRISAAEKGRIDRKADNVLRRGATHLRQVHGRK